MSLWNWIFGEKEIKVAETAVKLVQQEKTDATLYRVSENDDGTFGVLVYKNIPLCVTVENNWFDNAVGLSCIPEGIYQCVPHNGTKYKKVWKLEDVEGRKDIVIHWGNDEDDTRGCIIAGSMFGSLGGKHAVLRSMEAINKLRGILPPKFTLRITSV